MRIFRIISILLIPAALICIYPGDVSGHDAPAGAGERNITVPRVGETRVTPTAFIPDPFINTQLKLSLGYGQSSTIATPLLEVDGEPILGLEGQLLYVLVGFEYRYAIRDWLAVWAQISLAARLGNEIQSVLSQGASAATGFELGWLFRLYENDRHLLSTGISMRNGGATLVDILGWANGVIEGEDVELIRSVPTLGTAGDLRYAYAANDFTALQLIGTLSYSEAVDRVAGNEWYYGIGGLVSFDLSRRTGSPIGLALGYRYSTIPEGGDEIVDNAHSALINISYMGRPDFHIGLDLQLQRVPIQGIEDPAEFFTAVISSQYFF